MLWSSDLILETDDVSICSEAIAILIELIDTAFDPSLLARIIFSFLDRELPCQEDLGEYDEEIHSVISFLLKSMIKKLGREATSSLESLIPRLIEYCDSKNVNLREFGIQGLGQLAESSEVDEGFVREILTLAIDMVRNSNSSIAAFVINQCTAVIPSVVLEMIDEVFEVLANCLNEESPGELTDSCINALAAIEKDSLPIGRYLTNVLQLMPARGAASNNHEMMRFFLWLNEQTGSEPLEDFAAVLVRLFSIPKNQMGFFTTDSELVQELERLMVELLGQMENPAEFCGQLCGRNTAKLTCLAKTLDGWQSPPCADE
jgi:hypothetical protein